MKLEYVFMVVVVACTILGMVLLTGELADMPEGEFKIRGVLYVCQAVLD